MPLASSNISSEGIRLPLTSMYSGQLLNSTTFSDDDLSSLVHVSAVCTVPSVPQALSSAGHAEAEAADGRAAQEAAASDGSECLEVHQLTVGDPGARHRHFLHGSDCAESTGSEPGDAEDRYMHGASRQGIPSCRNPIATESIGSLHRSSLTSSLVDATITAHDQECRPVRAIPHHPRRGLQGDHRELQQDGRRSYAAIGKVVGLTEAAVRQRVQRLIDNGVMQVVAVTDPTRARLQPPGHDRRARHR